MAEQVDTGEVLKKLGWWRGGDPCGGIFPRVHVAGSGSPTYLRSAGTGIWVVVRASGATVFDRVGQEQDQLAVLKFTTHFLPHLHGVYTFIVNI